MEGRIPIMQYFLASLCPNSLLAYLFRTSVPCSPPSGFYTSSAVPHSQPKKDLEKMEKEPKDLRQTGIGG